MLEVVEEFASSECIAIGIAGFFGMEEGHVFITEPIREPVENLIGPSLHILCGTFGILAVEKPIKGE